MKKLPILVQDLIFSLIFALLAAAAAAFFQPAPWVNAWVANSLLLWLSFFLGLRVWRAFGGGKTLAALLLTAFFLRLVLGLFLHASLPVIGFDNEVQNAGFVYSDAYTRDSQAFELAVSGNSLFSAFSRSLHADQYGGLLFISSLVYRYLSPDVSRPVLITILGAMSMSLGLAFLFKGVLQRWGRTAALAAAWFYALYPEGVLLGSSQMREPFLIGLFCIGFWTVLNWREKIWQRLLIFLISVITAGLFSAPLGGAILGLLVLYALIDWLSVQKLKRNKAAGWLAFGILGAAFVAAGWLWLKPTMYYDAYLTERASGSIHALIEVLGGADWLIPFTALSGVSQPLLPAALTYPSLPIWMVIMSVRAFGWYFAIPFIVYAFFAAWKAEPEKKNWVMVLTVLAMAAWVSVSTLRAGGDQWDNPRYRALLIPWLAVLVGWTWQRLRKGQAPWFYRWLAVEVIFLLGFTGYYLNRYHIVNFNIGFFLLVKLVLGVTALIILSGLISDSVKRWQRKKNPPELKS